jgi:hypothetical protein
LKGYKISDEYTINKIYDVLLCKWLNINLEQVKAMPFTDYITYANIILPLEMRKMI